MHFSVVTVLFHILKTFSQLSVRYVSAFILPEQKLGLALFGWRCVKCVVCFSVLINFTHLTRFQLFTLYFCNALLFINLWCCLCWSLSFVNCLFKMGCCFWYGWLYVDFFWLFFVIFCSIILPFLLGSDVELQYQWWWWLLW